MIQVVGQKPLAIKNVGNHAPTYKGIVDTLVYEMLFGWIGQDDDVHTLRQGRTGMNSFSLELADGRIYHFRGWNDGVIHVKIHAQGNAVRYLKNENEAVWWIRRLKNKSVAA